MAENVSTSDASEDRPSSSRWKRLPERVLPTTAEQPAEPVARAGEQLRWPPNHYYVGESH